MAQIDTAALEEGLRRTAALVTVAPNLIAALRELVVTGTDREVLQVNPIRFAQQKGLDEKDTVTAFVGASKAGVFGFKWSLTCPYCGSYAHETSALSALKNNFYCASCNQESSSKMDSAVEVAFCINSGVRASPGKLALELPDNDWAALYRNKAACLDPRVVEALERNQLWSGRLIGLAEVLIDVALPARDTRVAAISHGIRATLKCPPGHAGAVVEVHGDGVKLVRYTEARGVSIRNLTPSEVVCVISVDVVPEIDFSSGPPFAPVFEGMLTGRDLLCNQAFRDLFAAETLSAGIALHVEQQTVLFTDLKGSTHLYDSIGDVRAFSLVSEHFKILLAAVQQCGGAVVKTIGDAVMATFPQTGDAVRAALQMADTLERFNASSGLPPLSLKIGVHVGACIVVSSNGRPDYFGQTVNIAARVQALAEGDELVLTDAAMTAGGVRELLKKHELVDAVSDVALKGVAEKVKVHTFHLS